jgi:hypothetical protein
MSRANCGIGSESVVMGLLALRIGAFWGGPLTPAASACNGNSYTSFFVSDNGYITFEPAIPHIR